MSGAIEGALTVTAEDAQRCGHKVSYGRVGIAATDPLQLQLSLFCDGGNGGGDAQSASPPPPTAVSDVQLSGTDAMWVAEEVRGKGEAIRWQVVFKPSAAKMTEALLAGANRSLGPDLHFKPKGFVLEDAVPEGRVQGILVGDPDTLKSVYEEIAADPVAFLPEEIEAAKQVWEDAVARKKAKDAAPKPKPETEQRQIVRGNRFLAALRCVDHALRTGGHTSKAANEAAAKLLTTLGHIRQARLFEKRAASLVL